MILELFFQGIRMKLRYPLLACMLLAGACAGRAPAPVAVVQPIDSTMDCAAIQAEILANSARVADLGFESGAKVAQNVAAGVAGAFFILPLFLMDFQGSAGIDQRALEARNQYLATLANARCSAPQLRSGSAGLPPAQAR
ncbi:hypothetical protein [Sediminicoccus sp. KRV36]|uniref:hypothetical protein n=1 Tax=Sediminicoccus sp. KRV36 TaxID=3133721 RepID=UPI00200DDF93|nr:hypothetical protein [Sediminicoccus rosea]UPY37762.1 hypothetical protein LHU95_03445 [Sediminicoccus rosea]